ncbi:hypothetical protein G9A89_002648 [Geosiphon pyriformis]|nr:hypothetical protein G9A89_002648 [Geosiphon pyriformis]
MMKRQGGNNNGNGNIGNGYGSNTNENNTGNNNVGNVIPFAASPDTSSFTPPPPDTSSIPTPTDTSSIPPPPPSETSSSTPSPSDTSSSTPSPSDTSSSTPSPPDTSSSTPSPSDNSSSTPTSTQTSPAPSETIVKKCNGIRVPKDYKLPKKQNNKSKAQKRDNKSIFFAAFPIGYDWIQALIDDLAPETINDFDCVKVSNLASSFLSYSD